MPLFKFPCAKDKSWNERYPNKSNAVILTANYNHFEEWEDCKQDRAKIMKNLNHFWDFKRRII